MTPGTDVGERLSLELLPSWDDDWLIPLRAGLSDRFLNALETHARDLEKHGDRDGALATVHHMLKADPLWEGAVGVQLEIYRAQWNRAKVERTYLTFTERLRRELGHRAVTRAERTRRAPDRGRRGRCGARRPHTSTRAPSNVRVMDGRPNTLR